MIFNSIEAERLYALCLCDNNPAAITKLHELSAGLIKAVALSLDPSCADDLIQEGHLKLQTIITAKKYKANKCSLYTFLSVALRNRMIDYLRKEKSYLSLYDNCPAHCNTSFVSSYNHELFDCYYPRRFPSLTHPSVIGYTKDALTENLSKARVIETIWRNYGLPKGRAAVMYNSVQIFLRYVSIIDCDIDSLDEPLANATNGHEFTLIPESILVHAPNAKYLTILQHVNILKYGTQTC